MEIKVKGCRNCPFAADGCICRLEQYIQEQGKWSVESIDIYQAYCVSEYYCRPFWCRLGKRKFIIQLDTEFIRNSQIQDYYREV